MSTSEHILPASAERVRRSTARHLNERIDREIEHSINTYATASDAAIRRRLRELDHEWDIERVLEVGGPTIALTGLVLGTRVDRKWLFLTGGVLSFLLLHGLQGWCPPLPILRRLGVRTRGEIDREKYGLLDILEKR